MTIAKGMGNGFPLAAVITRSDIAAAISGASFFNTFGGNPLACRIGSTVLDIIEQEQLQQNSLVQGERLIRGLERLRDRYAIVGDVRGQGLMVGIELVENEVSEMKSTVLPIVANDFAQIKRTPLPKADMESILEDCKDNGLLIGRGGALGNVFRITPPMCINEKDVEFTLDVLDLAFRNYGARK